ncbi:MAG: long-chain fatty acid--CoA ligase [Longimicrobiales bacterium]
MALLQRLEEAFLRQPKDGSRFEDDDAFNRWALEIHAAQASGNPTLRAFWASRGAESVDHWSEVPPVPASAFKATPFGPPTGAEAVFRTSGTSAGGEGDTRGEHRVASLDLYHAAARANYQRHLLAGSPRVLSLIPSVTEAPDSSLARMVSFIADEPKVRSITWAFGVESGVDVELCQGAFGGDGPILILATAFALVQLLDGLQGQRWTLPAGSGVMETGGFKGRTKEVSRAELYGQVEELLGVPFSHVVSEYGMTELLSQSYDGVIGTASCVDARMHRFPPWVRTRALNPATLEPQPAGEPGLLAHYDLANAGSVSHVLTEDMGVLDQRGGFKLLGRATGAEARGCSLVAEDFLAQVRNLT